MTVKHLLAATALSFALVAPAFAQDAAPAPAGADSSMSTPAAGKTAKHKTAHVKKAHAKKASKKDAMKSDASAPTPPAQ